MNRAPGGRDLLVHFGILQLRQLTDVERGQLIAFDLARCHRVEERQRKADPTRERVEDRSALGGGESIEAIEQCFGNSRRIEAGQQADELRIFGPYLPGARLNCETGR